MFSSIVIQFFNKVEDCLCLSGVGGVINRLSAFPCYKSLLYRPFKIHYWSTSTCCTLCKKRLKLGTLGIKALDPHGKSEKHTASVKSHQCLPASHIVLYLHLEHHQRIKSFTLQVILGVDFPSVLREITDVIFLGLEKMQRLL